MSLYRTMFNTKA